MVAVSPCLKIMTVPIGKIASRVVDMHACCFLPSHTVTCCPYTSSTLHAGSKLNSPVYMTSYVSMYMNLVFVYFKSVYIYVIICEHFSLFMLIAQLSVLCHGSRYHGAKGACSLG